MFFPESPVVDETFIADGKQWIWNGIAWKRIPLEVPRFRPITPGVQIFYVYPQSGISPTPISVEFV